MFFFGHDDLSQLLVSLLLVVDLVLDKLLVGPGGFDDWFDELLHFVLFLFLKSRLFDLLLDFFPL